MQTNQNTIINRPHRRNPIITLHTLLQKSIQDFKTLTVTMNIPASKRVIEQSPDAVGCTVKWDNVTWVFRNLAIHNYNHPHYFKAMRVLKQIRVIGKKL